MPPSTSRRHAFLPKGSLIGLSIALAAVVISALVTYGASGTRERAVRSVTHTREVLQELEATLSSLKDAETGQRGYLLSGEERYLGPFRAAQTAIPEEMRLLQGLVADNPAQLERLQELRQLTDEKLAELLQTINLRQAGNTEAALEIVGSDRGRATMDRARQVIGEMREAENTLLDTRNAAWERAVRASQFLTTISTITLVVLIAIASIVMSRDFRSRETQIWMRNGQAGLVQRIQGEMRIETLADHVVSYLAEYLDASVGAVYVADGGRYRRVGGYGVTRSDTEEVLAGEGLVGQVAKAHRTIRVTDLPDGYLEVSSGTGRARPAELLIAPAIIDGSIQAVIELGFFRKTSDSDRELLDRMSESLAAAVRGSRDRTKLEELLEETQRQSEELQTQASELQAQQEELRVNNEELEEQSRALRESQARLENQQNELEQINANLEEQTQMLEQQKDDLERAQVALTDKAGELERSNQYKSEFLANMSHELRTPLNSSLILATLLADNKDGNLTDEQVRFAQTIHAAGNDLLTLINDILDLSKIESGKVELSIESVLLPTIVSSLESSMRPMAEEKGLALNIVMEPDVPAQVTSDGQRLGQILKNLLSNAVKFTDRGGVTLRVSTAPEMRIAFAVSDTGIGIPRQQQSIIFEAFRQADGSTHRKYGGTGLGLSISRDLAHLLGGDLQVQSEPGHGSVFTLILPIAYGAARPVSAPVPARSIAPQVMAPVPAVAAASPLPPSPINDDRHALTAGSRRLLIVEDDLKFAEILRDLARERGFQVIAVNMAGDAMRATETFAPQAILLDVHLPDHSGLGVLDHLKRSSRTRHIPVHVMSVADHAQQALERGAVGYAIKPVNRQQLLDAFQRLDAQLEPRVRRVLVVEDDDRQRDSVRQLLSGPGVEIIGVATASNALVKLRELTFDCVVMDLKLPDLSGIELLEQMAAQEGVSFPPVIVYTGRTLTPDEEHRLRRFSKSIIIKDARSPERLLDEVTLFLHQVESTLPSERQQMLKAARSRDTDLAGRRILIVEDDARNIFALSKVLEPRGAKVEIARNGREAIEALTKSASTENAIDLVLMDVMMPEMDGLTATRQIRLNPEWKRLPIIALTAKAMKDDQEKCLAAGANDYMAKPFDVEKLLSLVRVWMPK